jgi:hypothetical protein
MSTADAQVAVDALVERRLPFVWEREGIKRVLIPDLSKRDQTLILLYSQADWTNIVDLLSWIEYSNASKYRSDILGGLHKERFVEFDRSRDRACITTSGVYDVEKRLVLQLDAQFV